MTSESRADLRTLTESTERLHPARFLLDGVQLGAALALARIRPTRRSAFRDLPPPPDPAAALRETGALAEDGRTLRPEVAAALRVAADPASVLSIVVNRAGYPEWREAAFLRAAGGGPFVVQGTIDGRADLLLLPSSTEATILIDELLALTDLPSALGGLPLALDLLSYAALLATADALQAAVLGARLSRSKAPEPLFTAEMLEDQLAEGIATPDTRWAASAAHRAGPVDLRAATGRLGNGLAALEQRGLASRFGQGVKLTADGFSLARAFGQLVTVGGLTLVVADDDGFTAAHATVFRSVVGIWAVTWSSVAAENAAAQLFALSAPAALDLVKGFLEPTDLELPVDRPVDAPRHCPSCGAPTGSKRFCTRCGERLTA